MLMKMTMDYHDVLMDDDEYLSFVYNHLYEQLHKVDHQSMDLMMYDDVGVIRMDLYMNFDVNAQLDLLNQHEVDR